MIARASAIISGKLNDREFNSNYRFIIDEDGTGYDASIVSIWFTEVPDEPIKSQ
ncbi:hypothetical protein [Clostridium sp.]|uniref:hypothetical protein n=1 Tax=Clostridium sp. TaxID=1506 RepID=UPI00263A063F|nr:hypothetical protein [Clostridium sp.]